MQILVSLFEQIVLFYFSSQQFIIRKTRLSFFFLFSFQNIMLIVVFHVLKTFDP